MADDTINPNIPAADTDAGKASDDPFEKHINIAIEAQDGPAPKDENSEAQSGDDKDKKPEGDKSTGADKKAGDSSGGDGKPQQQPNKEAEKDKKPVSGPKDLTLPDGSIIKAGAERRLYEQRENARAQTRHLTSELTNTRSELEKVRSELQQVQATVASVNGMPPAQLGVAAKIFTDLQMDPVGTVKKLLAELVATGHKIEDIGAGVDTLAIQRIIDAKLGQQQQTGPSEEEQLAEATREAQAFLAQYPDARPHDPLLARMLRDYPGMDLHTAYFQLKEAFVEKGFDWSRTLEDNVREQASSQQQQSEQKKQEPLINGRTPTAGDIKLASEVKVAHEDDDWSNIVRAAMRESGLNV